MSTLYMFLVLLALVTPLSFGEILTDPTLNVYGEDHRLVHSDRRRGVQYATDIGFCRLKGFKTAGGVLAEPLLDGPFVILQPDGEVSQTFPNRRDHRVNFKVFTRIECLGEKGSD